MAEIKEREGTGMLPEAEDYGIAEQDLDAENAETIEASEEETEPDAPAQLTLDTRTAIENCIDDLITQAHDAVADCIKEYEPQKYEKSVTDQYEAFGRATEQYDAIEADFKQIKDDFKTLRENLSSQSHAATPMRQLANSVRCLLGTSLLAYVEIYRIADDLLHEYRKIEEQVYAENNRDQVGIDDGAGEETTEDELIMAADEIINAPEADYTEED